MARWVSDSNQSSAPSFPREASLPPPVTSRACPSCAKRHFLGCFASLSTVHGNWQIHAWEPRFVLLWANPGVAPQSVSLTQALRSPGRFLAVFMPSRPIPIRAARAPGRAIHTNDDSVRELPWAAVVGSAGPRAGDSQRPSQPGQPGLHGLQGRPWQRLGRRANAVQPSRQHPSSRHRAAPPPGRPDAVDG